MSESLKSPFKAWLVEDRLIVWDVEEGRRLYSLGYYGKPLGIPKPKTADFSEPLLLDLMEAYYLAEKGLLQVYADGRKLSLKKLYRAASKSYSNFKAKYLVYRDLRERGLIVQPGIKFGCDFAVYERGPGVDHAPYLVQVKLEGEKLDATDIVRSGRLATAVKKRFIIAVPDVKTGRVQYLMFKWWRP